MTRARQRSESRSSLRHRLNAWRDTGGLERPAPENGLTAPIRVWLAVVSATLVVLAQALHVIGPQSLGSAAVWLVLQMVPGVAICIWWRGLGAAAFALYSFTAAVTVGTLLSLASALTGFWHPDALYALIAAATLVSFTAFALVNRHHLEQWRDSVPALSRPAAIVAALTALGMLLIWRGCRSGVLADRAGLLGVVYPWWYLGVALLIAAFAYALANRTMLAAPVLAGAVVIVFSQAVAYRTPNVMPAARHIGVMEYLISRHQLDPSLDIYQAWSGFFAQQAWSVVAARIADPFTVATWWPVLGTLTVVVGVRVLAGKFLDPHRAWVAAGIFALGNSLAINYFSPQAVVLGPVFAVIALLIGSSDDSRAIRLGRYSAVAAFSVMIAVTHQISPYMATLAILALILTRVIRPWWTFLLVLAPALAWALLNRNQVGGYLNPGAIANFFQNVAPPEHPTAAIPLALITQLTYLIPAIALVALTMVAAWALFRQRDRRAIAIALAGVSPAGLAVATDYGQEGIFRMALFALPWIAILAASSTPPSRLRLDTRHWAISSAWVVTATASLMAVNVVGQTGMDWARIMRPGTVSVVKKFEETAPRGAAILSVGTKAATPLSQTARYLEINYTSLDELAPETQSPYALKTGPAYSPRGDIQRWTKLLIAVPANGHYALLSDEIGAFDERYGNQLDSDYTKMRDAMKTDRRWKLINRSNTAELYRYVGRGARGIEP